MKITEMIKMFLYSRKKGIDGANKKCREGTLKIYEKHLVRFADWMLEAGVTDYATITRNHMRGFLEYLDGLQTEGKWAQSTYLQMLRSLRTFFHWVERDEECQEEKLGDKRLQKHLPVIPASAQRDDIPQNVDLKKFRSNFDTETVCGFRDYVITSLLASCGIRAGEVCNLTMESLRLSDYPPMMVVDGKTGPRPVPLGKEIVKLLKAWLKRRDQLKPAAESSYVFVSRMKPQLNSVVMGKAFRRHTKKFNLPRISPHTFRHAFCTNYLKEGGNIERLKTITGHSSYQILDGYLKKAKVASNEAHDELERVGLLKEI